ncbi:MAG: DUF4832 domain-containing protein [Phycisphaerales bacterium]|nr:DUF4832 domain-containing protein [Phycisphaerales bacterium]
MAAGVALLVGATHTPAACGEETVTVRPGTTDVVVLNPGKGWVLYGLPLYQSEQTRMLGTTGYHRFEWAEIEPEEGQFNWKLIDDFITAWAGVDKQSAFGVMCANSHSLQPYVTPKWVFNAGAKCRRVELSRLGAYGGSPGEKIVPVFDDPVFLDKLRAFVTALGKRYDGNPHIAYVDIRSYGNWGEGHLWPFKGEPISSDVLKQHIQFHQQAFRRTWLCLPFGETRYDAVYDWAVEQGIGMRRDGICGNSDGHETARAFGHAPGVFEFFGSYEFLKKQGAWDGMQHDSWGFRLVDCVERGKPSYIAMSQWGNESQTFLAAERPLIEKLANRMGYHFVLKEAQYPASLSRGKAGIVRMHWENQGVAPVYVPCVLALALLNDEDKVVDVCWANQCNPASWLPGPVDEQVEVSFARPGPGTFRLALALFHCIGDKQPAFRLGIDTQVVNGWYVLGNVQVQEGVPAP